MNFSYNWLAELVGGLDVPPEELSRLITLKTAESEGVRAYSPHLEAVCAARVKRVEPVSGGRNVKAVVETSRYGERTVVCGASNCRAGLLTAYVPAGTRLNGREIGKTVIQGIESDGMLASGAELGINRDAAGILELAGELDLRPDHIIEIDNKSLTHRPDLWGHHGMAREVAAILHKPLREPADRGLLPEAPGVVRVEIEDLDLCPRYSALVFENVTVQPSPLWLQYRLEAIGLNPINNIVDVTNCVMAEIAQPMHAFDADKLHGHTIYVRRARDGERLTALNEETYELTPANLVIADEAGAVALAGVIGGLASAISEGSRRIVLESANFSAASIRRTSAALKLRTDASMRFEKSQDPVNTVRGIARAVALLREISPGIRVAGGVSDAWRKRGRGAPIGLPLDWLNRKLGRDVEAAQVRAILEALEFGVEEPGPRVFSVSVPSWRATKDISIKDDLVEEVGRMIGYDSITPQAPLLPARVPPFNEEREYHHEVREKAAALGFTEVYNYSFLSEELARAFRMDPDAHVRVLNPIAADQSLLRSSLIPGLWRNIIENAKYFEGFRLFEIGREIHKRGQAAPGEVTHFAAAVFAKTDGAEHLMELKHLAETLAPDIRVAPGTALPYEHPYRTAQLTLYGKVVGRLAELHPDKIEQGRAGVLDIDLDALHATTERELRYKAVRRFPASSFDLSVVAGEQELAGGIQDKLAAFAGDPLERIEFLRQYSGPPLPPGKKSVSYRLTVASPERTLSSEEVSAIRQRIIDAMVALGYDLRV
ncbi:MAG: phenylalanine--tRNA ligase subunit beta [Acidobacteria bacterium]|nr:phenylalanine--tRNA ligase subunit beta [Acidobacteriota bacterium]